jgi:hypothetical protein
MSDLTPKTKSLATQNFPRLVLFVLFVGLFFGPGLKPSTQRQLLASDGMNDSSHVPSDSVATSTFETGVWAKVVERTCIRCHHEQGQAKDSEFLLETSIDGLYAPESLERNELTLRSIAQKVLADQSILLQKVVGGLEHGGGQVLKPNSTGYRILEQFVSDSKSPPSDNELREIKKSDEPTPFFEGVAMLPPERLLRRVTLSLVGRLPSQIESNSIQQNGLAALEPILDSILKEDAFYVRLKEGLTTFF